MSTATNHNTAAQAPSDKVAYTPPYAPNPQDYNYQWGQISAGPQAIAFKAVMQLSEILVKLMDMYNEQANSQIQAQSISAKAGANATISAAQQQAYQTMYQAATSFTSAGVAVGGMGLTSLKTKSNDAELTAATSDKTSLDNLRTQFSAYMKTKATDASVGEAPANPTEPKMQDAIIARKEQLLTGSVAGGSSAIKADPNALVTIGKDESIDINEDPNNTKWVKNQKITADAFKHMNNEELEAFNQRLTTAQDMNSKALNNCYSQRQTIQSQVQNYEQLANGLASGSLQAFSAQFQTKQGQQQAVSTLANSVAQQAGSTASTSQGLIAKFYDEEMQALSMLQQIAATATVRG